MPALHCHVYRISCCDCIILSYTCTILVLYLYYTCTILVLYLYYTCTTLYYTCTIIVLHCTASCISGREHAVPGEARPGDREGRQSTQAQTSVCLQGCHCGCKATHEQQVYIYIYLCIHTTHNKRRFLIEKAKFRI